jgi:hypothetical protein
MTSIRNLDLNPRPRRYRMRRGLIVPTGEAVAEALASIPAGTPWAWACLRLLPQIRGTRMPYLADDEMGELGFTPASDFPGLEMPPGVRVTFAIAIEPALITVGQDPARSLG